MQMKNIRFSVLLISLLVSFLSQAQIPENLAVKKINGKEYYQYTVQAGEGLYGLSKRFNVTQDDIIQANPDVASGLKNGQLLLIPVSKNKTTEKTLVKSEPVQQQTEIKFIEHKVEKKQTLFAISRKYDVNQEDIKKYNPDVEKGLKEGMILKIPQVTVTNQTQKVIDKQTTTPVKPNNQAKKNTGKPSKDQFVVHVVKAKETLYSISNLYKVDIADIIKLNPDCDKQIKTGTELKIPYSKSTKNQKQDSIAITVKEDTDNQSLKITGKVTPNTEPIRIAFLLPFMLDNAKTDNSSEKFVEFYSGALLAIQEAKDLGISFEIYCYDTEKSEQKITEILQREALRNVDLIVGPAFSNQIPIVSEFAKENGINTLIPFSPKVFDIDSNPFLFQFNPGTGTKINFVSNIIDKRYKYSNVIFVTLPEVNILDEGKIFANGLKSQLIRKNKSFTELDITDSENFNLISKLKENQENLIIFNTEKYSIAQSYINSVNKLSDYKIIIYNELSWLNQEDNRTPYMVVSPFKADINKQKLKKYNDKFNQYYKWNVSSGSSRYDLLGYDLTTYFIAQIFYYGTNFTIDKTKLQEMSGIQSFLKFERLYKNSGFTNQQLNFIESTDAAN